MECEERRICDAEWSALALQGNWSDFLKKWNQQAVLGELPDSLADRYLLQPRYKEVARAFCAWSLGAQEDLRDKLSAVPCPIKLITGERDGRYTQLAEEMQFPNCERIIIPEAGHRPLWENPEASGELWHITS